MLGSFYISYSGLLNFSKGLNVISNNVGNLNTPGFKASELNFQDAFYRYQYGSNGSSDGFNRLQIGSGVIASDSNINFRQGELRDTGNSLDVAIDGNGFFVLRQDGEIVYSRAGKFEFDDQGYLVDSQSGARVAGLQSGGALTDISISGVKSNPASATSEISFTNNLSSGSTSHTLNNVQVYDATGASHDLTIIFTNNYASVPGSWLIEVQDSTGATLSNGEIRYQGNGSPLTGFNTHSFSYAPTGAAATTITLNFGDPGSFTGSTAFSAGSSSTLSVDSQDGYGVGSLTGTEYTEDGVLKLTYSNGQTVEHAQLAFAVVDNLKGLTQIGKNLFRYLGDAAPQVSTAKTNGIGSVQGGKLELSNVELTEQFTDMIIMQRGYQASSQIISITNEMIQQLFNLRGGG